MCSILLPNWVQAKTVVPKVDRRARVQRLEQLETARRTANPRPTYGSTIVARTRRWTRTPQGDPLRRATPVPPPGVAAPAPPPGCVRDCDSRSTRPSSSGRAGTRRAFSSGIGSLGLPRPILPRYPPEAGLFFAHATAGLA